MSGPSEGDSVFISDRIMYEQTLAKHHIILQPH